jgi:hypothetical protein
MLLTITLTEPPATDLGYLLHKHPDRMQSFDVSAGQAHVFYPEAGEQRCTAALLLEIDPIGLVRGHRRTGAGGPEPFSLAEYVNDRPYAASSMLAVALGKVFRTTMTTRCDARPDLAARPLPLEISIPALSCRGGTDLAAGGFRCGESAVTGAAVSPAGQREVTRRSVIWRRRRRPPRPASGRRRSWPGSAGTAPPQRPRPGARRTGP